jgi:predicted nucleic acid-binding protein
MSSCFVDTNILVYAEDRDAGTKNETARSLVLDLWDSGDGVVSVQVLQEFFVTVTRKLSKPMRPNTASRIVNEYLSWRVVENTGDLLRVGIDLAQSAKLSLWDALIVAAAQHAGCDRLVTEDLSHQRRFGSLRIENPFR